VQTLKAQKIELNQEYPSPCCRRGQLTPITLTEAFGCSKCHQIFVIGEGGFLLEKLSTTYPYKKAWRWTGRQWVIVTPGLSENYLPVLLGIILVLLGIWVPLALRAPPTSSAALWAIMALLLAILPALMVLMAYRR
jgi:hypothetical protein